MSSVHCVVVWEWQSNAQWLPHNPGVTRTLERAHAKKLTRVVLADADPALRGHYVNLRTLTQCLDTPDGGSAECRVRRSCYSVQSPAGRGVRWEWARFVSPPLGGELNYEPLPMEVQCLVEEAFSSGKETVSAEGWVISMSRMTARCGGRVRLLRRVPHPPYPLTRSSPPPPPPPPHRTHVEGRRPRIPQQHTGSSVHSVQSVHSVHSVQSVHSVHSAQSAPASAGACAGAARGGARSASPRDRKPGLARQILHNLNIFSNSNKQSAVAQVECKANASSSEEQRGTDTECGSTRSGRRHSVDTVSTYLSHESKESLQASVGELLNCSAGSDDVFDGPQPPAQPDHHDHHDEAPASDGSILGVEGVEGAEGAWRGAVGAWVRAVACVQWGAVCPVCLAPLDAAAAPCVALAGCQHMLHLRCLQDHLDALAANQEPPYIECLVCGRVYGGREAPRPPHPLPPAPPPEGSQPPGSMAWRLQPAALPQHPHASTSILVTYNFQSGRQGPLHPVPGAPYYAVGFPRHSLLPDTPLGRQVLSALRVAWERRVLFAVCASQTTGREHVVSWRVRPPPAHPHHYAPPACPRQMLRDALQRVEALIAPHPHQQHC